MNSSSAARYFPGILAKRNGNGAHSETSNDVESLTSERGTEQIIEAEDTDEVLILRLQKKEVEVLGLLYRRYARLIYWVCVRILRDPAEAEDLVHDVFLCMYRRCRSFDPQKGSARSWLVQLAYHSCFNRRAYLKARHGQRHGSEEPGARVNPPEPSQNTDPTDSIIWNPRMKAAFRSLSEEQQLTLKLCYLRDYTLKEIAQELGWSYDSVKHHVYRGIGRLRHIVFEGPAPRTCHEAMAEIRCESKDMAG